MDRYNRPWIVTKMGKESLPDEKASQHIETIRKALESGKISRDSVLAQLTQKAYQGGIDFDWDYAPNLSTKESPAELSYASSMFRRLCEPGKTTINQTTFTASLKRRLSWLHREDTELDTGLGILFRMLKHFSVFPFDSTSVQEIGFDGFIRAVYFIDEPPLHEPSFVRTGDLRIGGQKGV
jgi:hypothetical protein